MQKTQAPVIILFCNNKKAYIPYLYLNGRSVAKKPKYVWNMLDYNYSKYFRRTHDVQHQLKKRICYSALKKKFEKFEFFFQSAEISVILTHFELKKKGGKTISNFIL